MSTLALVPTPVRATVSLESPNADQKRYARHLFNRFVRQADQHDVSGLICLLRACCSEYSVLLPEDRESVDVWRGALEDAKEATA